MKKNKLDEMQEQKMLHIEHNGCYLAFWGLLAVMAVEGLLKMPLRAMLGEWVVFMALCLYILVDCLRNGIWDRRWNPSWKVNLAGSTIAGVFVGIFATVTNPYLKETLDYVLVFAISGGTTFALTFGLMTLCGKIYRKRRESLEKE